MTEHETWPETERALEAGIDFDRANAARIYDYLLGGGCNFAVDREQAAKILVQNPDMGYVCQANRAFLGRAVAWCLARGIDQFLDLGSGVPTMGNVHEIVARAGSRARVVYTDLDPVALAHGQYLLADVPEAVFLGADLRDVDAVLDAAFSAGGLDPERPVGLLAFSVFQHVPDADDPVWLIDRYLRRLAPGSALALSHLTGDDERATMSSVEDLTAAYSRTRVRLRGHDEVRRLVAGVDLVEPGLSWASRWRPDPGRPPRPTDLCAHWAAVGFLR